jgi:hypothetical protein
MTESVPVFLIAQILDRHTVVLVGDRIHVLSDRPSLIIVAHGPEVPGTQCPLVIRKADLQVDEVAHRYAIAKTPKRKETATVRSVKNSLLPFSIQETTSEKPQADLNVPQNELQGNPARQPVRTGDVVIRELDYDKYVAGLAAPEDATK